MVQVEMRKSVWALFKQRSNPVFQPTAFGGG